MPAVRIILSFFFALFFTSSTPFAHAATMGIVNAGVLQNIWYSSVDVYDGDTVNVYGGVYNQSSSNFSGTATFYIDGKPGKNISFISKSGTLQEIVDSWKAYQGDHKIQLKITGPASNPLVSTQSDEDTLLVKKHVVPAVPLTFDKVKNDATNVAVKVVDSANTLSNSLADKIESYKKPVVPEQAKPTNSIKTKDKNPAGTTASVIDTIKNFPVFNYFLDLLSALVRHWKTTLTSLIALYLMYRFIERRK